MSTKIEWAEETWNPVTGCGYTKISTGCRNCYAKRMSKRLAGRAGYPPNESECRICHKKFGVAQYCCPEHPRPALIRRSSFDVTLHPDKLEQPLHWRKPRRVFVCSMGDLFHEDVSDEFIDAVFAVMWVATHHTFLVLTKRPERMQRYIQSRIENRVLIGIAWRDTVQFHNRGLSFSQHGWNWGGYVDLCSRGAMPRPNLWLGVTAENQEQADKRIPILSQVPAAVRFASVEPCLGNVETHEYLPMTERNRRLWQDAGCKSNMEDGRTLDWVICGAETGPGARPMNLDWARELRDQCQAAGVPFFFKKGSDGSPLLDGQMWNEYPERIEP